MRKIKYKDKQAIVNQKKFEKSVDNLFSFCKKEMLEDLETKGLPQLLPLCDGPTLGFYSIRPTKPEDDSEEAYFKLSKILNLDFPEEDKEEGRGLFVLPPSFVLNEEKEGRKIYASSDKEAGEAGHVYLENCLRFPNINILNAIELKAIREYLEPMAVRMRRAVDEWMRMCEEESDSKRTVEYFRNEVQTRSAEVAAKIKEHEVLQHYDQLLKFSAITNVWMGEVPLMRVWEFYREAKVIPDETWEELMKMKEKVTNRRCPVMALELPGLKEHIEANKQKIEMTEVAPVKKSLSMN